MRHKLPWQFLQMVWQFPPFHFFPVQFHIKPGVSSSLCKVKEPKPFPCYPPPRNIHLSVSIFSFTYCSNVELCHAITLFHTFVYT